MTSLGSGTKPISKARAEQVQRDRLLSITGSAFLLGAVQFLLLTTISESLYQGYSVRDQTLSELGVGQVALLWNTSLFLLGVSAFVGGYFGYRTLGSRLTLALSFIFGIGCVGASLFTLDSPTGVHGFFALLVFFGGALFALSSYRVTGSNWMKLFSVLLGLYSLVAIILHASGINFDLGSGGMERMIVYPLILWLAAFAGYLLHTFSGEHQIEKKQGPAPTTVDK